MAPDLSMREGWLKLRLGSRVAGNWERRWCVLRPGHLEVYRDDESPNPEWTIPLSLANGARALRDDPEGLAQNVMRTSMWGFVLPLREADDWRCVYLDAESSTDRWEWMAAINECPSTVLLETCRAVQVQLQELRQLKEEMKELRRPAHSSNALAKTENEELKAQVETLKAELADAASREEELRCTIEKLQALEAEKGKIVQSVEELRHLWVEKVKEDWTAFEDAPEAIKADPEVALAAVMEYGPTLSWAAEHLKADQEVVLAAVRADPEALEHASERIRADRASILELVRATKAAFIIEWATEELREDAEFAAQCRAAAGTGLVWTFYHSSMAFLAMRRSFPTAGASVPGGPAYEQVMKEVRNTAHGSTATVWFADTPVWGFQADGKKWIHPPHKCGRHYEPVPPPEGRHEMWNAPIESRIGDEEPEVGSRHPCWCCAWIEEVLKKAAEGNIICCTVSNIFTKNWVEEYGAGSSELSDTRAEEFGLRKETFRNGRPAGWGHATIKTSCGEFSREAPVHPRTSLPLGEGCRWERMILDQLDFPVYAFFQP